MKKKSRFNPVWKIVAKELRRVFLDKKLVFALFILPLLITVGMYSLIGVLAVNEMEETSKHEDEIYLYELPKEMKMYVNQLNKAKIREVTLEELASCKEAIKQGEADLLVTFEKEFSAKVVNYKEGDALPEIKTYYNPTEDTSNNARNTFIEKVLTPYKNSILQSRLGDLNQLSVFILDKEESTSQLMDTGRATGKVLGSIIPYMVTIFLFAGAMSLCIDSITGEKERGTLTSLLISPVSRGQLVMGKLLSLSILSCLSAITYALSMLIALPYTLSTLTKGTSIGLKLAISFGQIIELLLLVLILVYLYVVIISLVAVFAKSAKEASSYVSPLYMVIVVAGMITMFQGDKEPGLYQYGIPVYGTAKAIQSLLTGELTLAAFAVNILVTLLIAFVLTGLMIKAFKSEKLMLNA